MMNLTALLVLARLVHAPAGASSATFDACGLLTAAEIRGVQGGALRNRKPASLSQRGLAVSQCFFELDPFASSVSLEVSRRAAPGGAGRGPREKWTRAFHRAEPARKTEEGESRESNLEPVAGLGDEAFWVPNRMGGAIYVLRNDVSLRLSVGGKGGPEAKREKSKLLARKALEKL